MNTVEVIQSQYLAALEMLFRAIDRCPDSLWNNAAYKNQFWQVAFHALFFVHFYLQPSEHDFVPWAKYRQDSEGMEQAGEPYTKAEIMEYLQICRQQVKTQLPALDLEAPSGFDWLPFKKLELQLYNLRHLQQHVGELSERLGEGAQIEVGWVGSRPE